MTAYLILMQQVEHVERYRTGYVPGVRPFLERYGAEVPLAGLEAEAAEGEPPNSTVVLRIPTPRWHGACSTIPTTSR